LTPGYSLLEFWGIAATRGEHFRKGAKMNENQKRELAETPVTLNGLPAQIVGVKLDFAKVRTLDPYGPEIEYAWPTVARIVASGGKFITLPQKGGNR